MLRISAVAIIAFFSVSPGLQAFEDRKVSCDGHDCSLGAARYRADLNIATVTLPGWNIRIEPPQGFYVGVIFSSQKAEENYNFVLFSKGGEQNVIGCSAFIDTAWPEPKTSQEALVLTKKFVEMQKENLVEERTTELQGGTFAVDSVRATRAGRFRVNRDAFFQKLLLGKSCEFRRRVGFDARPWQELRMNVTPAK